MNDAEFAMKVLRHLHAAVAMHGLLLRADLDESPPVQAVAEKAFALADAMIEKAGPLE